MAEAMAEATAEAMAERTFAVPDAAKDGEGTSAAEGIEDASATAFSGTVGKERTGLAPEKNPTAGFVWV